MRIVNATFNKVNDNRTGLHKRQEFVRAVRTPYGNFRSVALLRDHIMTREPGFWIDLVGKRLTVEDIAGRVYQRAYKRCQREDYGWSFE